VVYNGIKAGWDLCEPCLIFELTEIRELPAGSF